MVQPKLISVAGDQVVIDTERFCKVVALRVCKDANLYLSSSVGTIGSGVERSKHSRRNSWCKFCIVDHLAFEKFGSVDVALLF